MNARIAGTDVAPPTAVLPGEPPGAGAPRLPAPRVARDGDWTDRLPRLPASECGAGRGLAATSASVATARGAVSVSFHPPSAATAAELLELQGSGALVALAPPFGPHPADLDWRDHAGVSRVLAFAIAHADLLDAWESLLGLPLVPAWCHGRTDLRRIDGGVYAGYALTLPDGGRWRGDAWFDAGALAALRAAAEPPLPATDPRWDALPVPCRVVHGLAPLPVARLRELRPHDIVVLGARASVRRTLRFEAGTGGLGWCVVSDGSALVFNTPCGGPASQTDPGGTPMNEQPAAPNPPEAIDALRLELTVELARLELPLGTLRTLSVGDSLPLPIPLEGARATLRVGGRAIGHGELVAAGEQLGLRVLALDPARDA